MSLNRLVRRFVSRPQTTSPVRSSMSLEPNTPGTMITGQGEKVDESKGMVVPAGGYFIIPGKTAHWGRATEDVVLNRLGNGPRDIFYFEKK